MCVCSVTSLFATLWTVARHLFCPWDFPGKNTRVGCHFLLQGNIQTQGSNLHSPHWQAGSLIAQSCLILCDPMDYSTLGLPVHHQLPELAQTHVHSVGDAIQPSYPLSDYLLESLIVTKLLYRLRVVVKILFIL